MNLGSAKRFLYIGCIVSVVLFALFMILQRPVICYICLAVGAVTAFVWGMYGRCPNCGKWRHMANYEHCPHCGEKIEW